ncbi:hypothetical protein [Pseudomonas viridiflava]|uniref:hypothetical protein n=1 Tax=Pseudomonas viridiflava TaxID=33069 RepID=UPI001303239D|nr:hypothetical protein [Pseudomonas viridiflava]
MKMFQVPQPGGFDLAPTTDFLPIECTYQGHEFYSARTPICLSINLVFIKYAATHRRLSGYALRQAVILFFDFGFQYNKRNQDPLKLVHLTDLTAEVFTNFQAYLLKHNELIGNASKLKTAIKLISKETDLLPNLMLPAVPRGQKKAIQPLTDGTYKDLVAALTAHTDVLYKKLEFRHVVHAAEPYEYQDILNTYTPQYSKANIFKWAQDRLERKQKLTSRDIITKLKHTTAPDLKVLLDHPDTRLEFRKVFEAREECYRFARASNPFESNSLWHWDPDDARALKTLMVNGYPFEVSLDEIANAFTAKRLVSLHDCEDIVQLMLFRFNRLGLSELVRYPVKPWDDLLAMYYPSMMDMAALIMLIMLQSNWNKETVLAVDGNNFEHPLTGAMSEAQVLIQSEKNRSQGFNLPYYAPKEIVAVSSKDDRYSSYNLLKLAADLSEPLRQYEYDSIPQGQENLIYNEMFLCLRYYANWVGRGGRHTSATNYKAFLRGVKDFLIAYPVYEHGTQLQSAKQITKRLRPTWALFQRKIKGTGLGLLAMQMGHQHTTVTDVHYDSSGAAVQERLQRLRSELEAVMDLLLQGRWEGMLGKRPEAPVQLPLKIFHIPGMDKPLWGCTNQRQPTWPGADVEVEKGERCYSIRNCIFCKRIEIYEDSLPYLVERRIHVVELIDERPESSSEYSSTLESERAILNYLLSPSTWDDPDVVKEAGRIQRAAHRRNQPLLPRDLSFLQLIFEEEDMV